MSLRELVTGSDMCSAGDGAGPSNAMASLANALLGGKGKQQEQLSELPGMAAGPGPSSYAPVPMPTVEGAAHAAVQGGGMPAIPGLGDPLHGPSSTGLDIDEFLRQQQHLDRPPGMMGRPGFGPALHPHEAEFDRIFDQGGAAGRQQQHHHMPGGFPPAPVAPVITQSFKAFLDSGRAGSAFMPMQLPPDATSALPPEAQCRIRDRSAILARHLFADRGDAFADQQVAALMSALRIDVASLPVQAGVAGGRWVEEMAAAEAAQAGRMAAAAPAPGAWADEFAADLSGLSLSGQQPGWAEEFTREAGPEGWAAEFQAADAASARVAGVERAVQGGGSRAVSRDLADALASSSDPKMRNSKFLQFVSKMSQGEVVIDGNQVREIPAEVRDWAAEFQTDAGPASGWASEFQAGGAIPAGPEGWASEFAEYQQQQQHGPPASSSGLAGTAGGDAAVDWAQEFADGAVAPLEVEAWAEQFAATAEQLEREYQAEVGALVGQRDAVSLERQAAEYTFAAENPFMADTQSMAKARDLFRSGLLSEAVLAVEAEVQRQPGNADAWRLLGTVHAENDDDRQAIAALCRALVADPDNLDALLALGVSFTNELDQGRALDYLYRWLSKHPVHGQVAASEPPLADASQRLLRVSQLFAKAAEAAPQDADVHSALGVLRNLTRDYDGAAAAFRFALSLRPNDYSLWNKLGATLANGNHSSDAVAAYQKALDAKPNYMRAWTNMGIAQANLGNYEDSARFYVRALTLNPRAPAVWGYLRTSVVCASRGDLLEAVDGEDVNRLAAALGL